MNNFGSIIKYCNAIENNYFLKAISKVKVNKDLYYILKSIDNEKFKNIVSKYKDYDPYPGYSKYLNIKPWMLDNIWRVYLLGLNSNRQSKNILDIGTGNGYFPYVCKFYGHKVSTIDIGFNPIFNELIDLLNIPRLEYAIKAFESVPLSDTKFDIVTGFHTYFNGHRTQNLWTSKEWDFFMKDLKYNLCNNDAEAFFILNKEHETDSCYTPELYEYFIKNGAEIDDNRVYFRNLNKF